MAIKDGSEERPKISRLGHERAVRFDALMREAYFQPEARRTRWTAEKLAVELETSVRSIGRSVEYLRDLLEMPLVSTRKLGYHYTERPRELPNFQVSRQELIALCMAKQALEYHRGTPFEADMRMVFDKLCRQFDEATVELFREVEQYLAFESAGYHIGFDPQVFQEMLLALWDQEEVMVDYWSHRSGAWKQRRLRTLRMLCSHHAWYARAFDVDADQVLTFALSRIRTVQTLGTTFKRGQHAAEDLANWRNGMGPFGGGKPRRIRLLFDARIAPVIREMQWQFKHRLIDRERDRVELHLYVAHTIDLERFVMGYGPLVLVLGPISLKEVIQRNAEQMVANYENGW